MSKQQLYINDVAVDMPSDTIKIKVESNLFSDASNIMTAHSYSISLPRTMTNDSVFALAYVAGANTGGVSTHRYLPCAFEIDGIPLFSGGRCVLTAVDDKGYKCNLYFGLLGIFDKIKEEGLDLCDLPMSKYYPYQVNQDGLWMELPLHFTSGLYVSGMNQTLYNSLSSDSKKDADFYPWGLLTAKASDILAVVSDIYGLTLDLSPQAQTRIAELRHPLTSLKSLAKDEKVIINLKGAWNYFSGDSRYHIGFQQPTMIDQYTIDYASYPLVTNVHSATEKWQANNAIGIPQDSVVSPYRNMVIARTKISVEKVRVYGTINAAFPFDVNVNGESVTSHLSGGVQTIDHTWEEGFDVERSGIFIELDHEGQAATSPTAINLNVELTVNKIGDVGTYLWWNDIRNYPQMSVIAYLNEILAHIGGVIVGSINTPNKLRIVTFDEVAEADAIAYDIQGVKNIKMTMDKLAQKNNYIHKENDDAGLPYDASGVIYTNDDTLALERKAFESKFKVQRNTIVRLWLVEKNDGGSDNKATWKGGSDYISGYDSSTVTMRNTGQDFATTIANYYTNYESIVNRPKVVEVIVKMSILELLDFNFEHPIFIPQLGRTYLVKTLETDSNDTYKLTLVQI